MIKPKLMLALALAALCFFSAGPAGAKTTIHCQQCYSTKLITFGSASVWLSHKLAQVTGGELSLKIYEPGELVPCFEVLEAVSSGKIDAGWASAGLWAGKLPAAQVISSLPFGPEADEYMAWMFQGNGWKLAQEMYDKANYKIVTIPAAILVPETSGWFQKPIIRVDDLKGLRMHYYGLGGQVMQKLGVKLNLMMAKEIFSALEQRAIHATEFSIPSIDRRWGFYKVAQYNYYPGWHQQAAFIDLIINRNAWDRLKESQQELIKMACMATIVQSIAEGEASQGQIIKENQEKMGVHNMFWSKEMLDAFKKAWDEVAAEQGVKDPMFKKMYEDLKSFRAEYKYWKDKAFLPRNCEE